jgi:hypothetical protein
VKIILGIFCGLVVLFAGGCALMLMAGSGYNGMFQSLPVAFIPGGIAALNVLVLIALFGTSRPHLWAFYVLALLDVLVVLALGAMWLSFGFTDSEVNTLGFVIVGGFAAKAVLTVATARKLMRSGGT